MADKEEPKLDFIGTARKRFEDDAQDEKELRDAFSEDIKFVAGDQWEDRVRVDRLKAGRPALTFNRCHTFVQQVANEARQMRGEVKFIPAQDSDKDTAEIYEGLARHIQYNSKARQAYETAVDFSAGGGWGYYRFLPEYCDDESFDQEVNVTAVHDPLQVYGVLVPACYGDEPPHAFVIERLTREEYQQQYPNDPIGDWEVAGKTSQGWIADDKVRVAEYWYVETEQRTLYELEDGSVVDKLAEGQTAKRERTVEDKTIKFCKINGLQVLSGTKTEWPGKRIPIFPVLGKGMIVEGKPRLFSVVRFQKAAQQLINIYKSRIAETIGVSPISPYMVVEGQISTPIQKAAWEQINTRVQPYVTYNLVDVGGHPAPAPQRQTYEPPIAALSEATAQEIDDMKATAGIYDASLGAKSNEASGIAIARRQQQSNITNLHFMDNLERSFDDSGRELAAVIPVYYDTPRTIRILGPDEAPKVVKINQQFQQGDRLKQYKIGGDGVGKYDVLVSMGRAFSTKRMESFDMMTQVLQTSPNLLPMIGDIFFKNSDLAGSDQLAERFKKMLPPNLQDQQPEEPQIPPQVVQQMQALQQELQGAKDFAREQFEKAKGQDVKLQMAQMQHQTDLLKLKLQLDSQEAQTAFKAEMDLLKTRMDALQQAQQATVEAEKFAETAGENPQV